MLGKFVNWLTMIIHLTFFVLTCCTSVGAKEIRLSILGDSLTAGYGLSEDDALPHQIETLMRGGGYNIKVLGEGVSGDTSAGALERLDWVLKQNPHAIIVAIGANDGLRGLDPDGTYKNLRAIIKNLTTKKIPILLCGMKAPPNLGSEYTVAFKNIYSRVATEFDVVYYPFFLEGIITVPSLNQSDGIHPNKAGVKELTRRLEVKIIELLKRLH